MLFTVRAAIVPGPAKWFGGVCLRFSTAVFCVGFLDVGLAWSAANQRSESPESAEVAQKLHYLRDADLWGEVVLDNSRVRSIKVDSVTSDSAMVREILGPLQERPAKYALHEFKAVRELGEYRIPPSRASHMQQSSLLMALLLETAIPSAGFFYIGDSRKGFFLLGFTAAAVGTALASRKEGVAGWLPLAVWVKGASLITLYEEVRAMKPPDLFRTPD